MFAPFCRACSRSNWSSSGAQNLDARGGGCHLAVICVPRETFLFCCNNTNKLPCGLWHAICARKQVAMSELPSPLRAQLCASNTCLLSPVSLGCNKRQRNWRLHSGAHRSGRSARLFIMRRALVEWRIHWSKADKLAHATRARNPLLRDARALVELDNEKLDCARRHPTATVSAAST